MTFGATLKTKLDCGGYSLLSEFLTPDGRMAVRLQLRATNETCEMFLTDAVELTRGVTTAEAIRHRNRNMLFQP
jgi:hypothetical protein